MFAPRRITESPVPPRAVIYARYSSDLQSEVSIEDQIRLCRELCATSGWEVAKIFSDAAISGASRFRPDYQALLEGIRARAFDVVVAEGLDRLSRDPEDTAALIKALKFADIRLVTRAEGEVDDLRAGFKGTMNALFLTDLAVKTRRGLRGRVVAAARRAGAPSAMTSRTRSAPTASRCAAPWRSTRPRRRRCGGSSPCSPPATARSQSPMRSMPSTSPALTAAPGATPRFAAMARAAPASCATSSISADGCGTACVT
jgi:hypothetical protein